MFLELAEALDCPVCRDGYGLVAFVRESESRRVLSGHLGCPICELEAPIANGVIRVSPLPPEPAADRAAPAPPAAPRVPPGPTSGDAGSRAETDADTPLKLAALLGLGDRAASLIALGPELARYAVPLTRLAERLEAIIWLTHAEAGEALGWRIGELAHGLNPIVGADPARWPVRPGVLDGVALVRPSGELLAEAARTLRSAGRAVVLNPVDVRLEALADLGLDEVASDPDTWLGQRR